MDAREASKQARSTFVKKDQEQNPEENPGNAAYHISWFDRIPYPVRALVIKYWFMGCAYFFFVTAFTFWMGDNYSIYLQMIILGVAMGVFNEFLVYNIFEAMESARHEAFYYEIFKSKKFYSLLINLVYGILWSVGTSLLCAYLVTVTPANDFGLWREPLTFALMGFVIDGLAVAMKDGLVLLFRNLGGNRA
jgi:hypothetical protein